MASTETSELTQELLPRPSTPSTKELHPDMEAAAAAPTTPQKPKSPHVQTPADTKPEPPAVLALEQDLVIQGMVTGLKAEWRKLIQLLGMILGSTRVFHTRFTPDYGHIREKVAPTPIKTLSEIASLTENAMLESWSYACRHVAEAYWRDMRRDLICEAKRLGSPVKARVLGSVKAEAQALAREQQQRQDEELASGPPATPTVGTIREGIEKLSIDSERSPRYPFRTPRAPKTPGKGPEGQFCPVWVKSATSPRKPPPRTPDAPSTPTRLPVKARTPPGYEATGRIGRHVVFSPIKCARGPPRFGLVVKK
ncbi:hypothetical protein F5Y19DRAFT_237462 [Xylariaceae sp. FL1651]|nr:hypothetical protein F5Y19DRAFT_237462 [Xylariaceae sp. FL1651]